jgi:hypothetical protein
MRLTRLIVFFGIALAVFPAFAASRGNAVIQTSVSTILCPTLEGYPDCGSSDDAARAFYKAYSLRAISAPRRPASPAKLHRAERGFKPGPRLVARFN